MGAQAASQPKTAVSGPGRTPMPDRVFRQLTAASLGVALVVCRGARTRDAIPGYYGAYHHGTWLRRK